MLLWLGKAYWFSWFFRCFFCCYCWLNATAAQTPYTSPTIQTSLCCGGV